jgi:hypothetical protein
MPAGAALGGVIAFRGMHDLSTAAPWAVTLASAMFNGYPRLASRINCVLCPRNFPGTSTR